MGLVDNILKGDEKSAARLITGIENGEREAYRELSLLFPHTGKAHIIGVTGPAGAGKSTLIGQLALMLSGKGRSVGVIATDPTSVNGKGAFLGDRVRMKGAEEQNVFIRSMAHRSHPGGFARGRRRCGLRDGGSGQGPHHRGEHRCRADGQGPFLSL
jgi:LAO/AO transport system kinase